MTKRDAERLTELEESADGVEFFGPPGEELQLNKARDQAEASGWIPERETQATPAKSQLEKARTRRDELREAMQHLETTVARPAAQPGWADAVASSLEKVQTALEAHIRDVEGSGGLLSEIVTVAPRLSSEVELIQTEHGELRETLRSVQHRFGSGTPVDVRAIRRRVLSLLARLAAHRQRGSDLVYEAYTVDIGLSE